MKNLLVPVMALSALLSSSAFADTIDLTLTNLNEGGYATFSSNSGGSWQNNWAGTFGMVGTNSTNITALPNGAYDVFCLELLSTIYFNTKYTYTVTGLTQVPNGTPGHITTAGAEAIQDMWNFANGKQFKSNDYAEAFQLALWEITFDNVNDSLTGGVFRAKSLSTGVNNIVAELFGAIKIDGTPVTLAGLSHKDSQDLLVNPHQNTKVVEPNGVALLGLGLLGLGAFRRRKV